jgi:hypothetical protein
MIVTIANFKGSGKRTTAIHLAAFMQTLGSTILANGDIVRASSKWAARGDDKGMSFKRSPSANLHELVECGVEIEPRRDRTPRRLPLPCGSRLSLQRSNYRPHFLLRKR